MELKTQQGFLVLADIAGYSAYVAATELEHANIALSYLLETIIDELGEALTIVKLEGDAVFAYAGSAGVSDGPSLLALIDQTYAAFRQRAETLYAGKTCDCRACMAIPTLDLKFMLHHGDFIVQQVAGIRDLLGADVNLVHRLMKNRVAESTGWRGYALITQQAVEQIQADESDFFRQTESHERFGDVETYVLDLDARYRGLKAA
jgi:hypothetical protein